MSIQVKRVYDALWEDDGARILVDRLWPRGLSKEKLKLEAWMKELAPSNDLRKWYNHEESKWAEFQNRYFKELDGQADLARELQEKSRRGRVTLLFSSRELINNNASALKIYLERKSG